MEEEMDECSFDEEISNEEKANDDEDDDEIHILEEQVQVEEPRKNMEFKTVDQIFTYYKEFGKQMGFGVSKASCSKTKGVCTYVTIACSRGGKPRLKNKISVRPRATTKIDCKARICAKLAGDAIWRLSTVELTHNHLCCPAKWRRYRFNRFIKPHAKRRIELNEAPCLPIHKSIDTLVVEAGGYDNLTHIDKDVRNHSAKQRRWRMDGGDAVALQEYFKKMQEVDREFFYLIDFDDDNRVRNLFWADARSRAAYEEFGDVIMFDTTYLTNKYDMPFAPFVGVNHHGQSTLLGCGLIGKENAETFTWLFETWLICMGKIAPSAIITDQDKAMKKAVKIVFPDARHRWCLWHIMKKIPEKLKGYVDYDSIKVSLENVVYDSLSIDEFEFGWKEMIDKYNLENNTWLKELFEERCRWVPCFVKDHFWAGMSTTQRSESMNVFFGGYVNAKTSLKQFVEQYDRALLSKVEKEDDADFSSFNSCVPVITQYPMEKQLQSMYTTSKFMEFQEQLRGLLYCVPALTNSVGLEQEYEVSELIFFGENGKNSRRVSFKVHFIRGVVSGDVEVKCNCRLFEFRGILCKHTLLVLIMNNHFSEVPSKYILHRWRKDITRRYTKTRVSYNTWRNTEGGRRYDEMLKFFYNVADIAFDFENKCKLVNRRLLELKKEVLAINGVLGSSEFTPSPDDSQNIKSPIAVRCKGRPPNQRKKQSSKRSKKKVSTSFGNTSINGSEIASGNIGETVLEMSQVDRQTVASQEISQALKT